MDKESVVSAALEMEKLPLEVQYSIREGVRRCTNGEFGWLLGYSKCLVDCGLVGKQSGIASLPQVVQRQPGLLYGLAATLRLDEVSQPIQEVDAHKSDFCDHEANHVWLRMEGGAVVGDSVENEQFGCVPMFKTREGQWCFSDGPYGVVEMFYSRHGIGFGDQDDEESEPVKGLADLLIDRFTQLILDAASRLASKERGSCEDLDIQVENLHYRIKVTHVICDRYGNEGEGD